MSETLRDARRIVVKVGTSTLTYDTGKLNIRGIEQIKQEIEDQLEDHINLIGVQKISLKRKTYGFIDLCGQLRFQKRWSQSPRIPATSVLGHMLMVAIWPAHSPLLMERQGNVGKLPLLLEGQGDGGKIPLLLEGQGEA